jgi:hypothetical protein
LIALTAVYAVGSVALGTVVVKRGAAVRAGPWDLALLGLATHKLSRRISKDSVTSPFRRPFADVVGHEGPGEVAQRVRGAGVRRAVGELLTCPFCVGQWVATGLVFTDTLSPRVGRLLTTVFATAAVADFLQFGYAGADRASR